MLSDRELRAALYDGTIVITPPPADHQIQPASIDLRLAPYVLVPRAWSSAEHGLVSVDMPPSMVEVEFPQGVDGAQRTYVLKSGQFCLVSTFEKVALSPSVGARVEGRSTLARLGLTVHAAGFIDPGFRGHVTLELKNDGPWDIELTEHMRIAQLCVFALSSPAIRPYGDPKLGSKYQDQHGAKEAQKERLK